MKFGNEIRQVKTNLFAAALIAVVLMACSSEKKENTSSKVAKSTETELSEDAIRKTSERQAKEEDFNAMLTEINQLFKSGNMEAALGGAKQITHRHPDQATGWAFLGQVNFKTGNDSAAYIAYSKAIQLDATEVNALSGLGIYYRKNGDYNTSAEYYKKAIEADPSFANAYTGLSVVELKREKFASAVEYGEKAYANNPENASIVANLAIAYYYNGDEPNRLKFYEMAKQMGYPKISTLDAIFSGKKSVLDKKQYVNPK